MSFDIFSFMHMNRLNYCFFTFLHAILKACCCIAGLEVDALLVASRRRILNVEKLISEDK